MPLFGRPRFVHKAAWVAPIALAAATISSWRAMPTAGLSSFTYRSGSRPTTRPRLQARQCRQLARQPGLGWVLVRACRKPGAPTTPACWQSRATARLRLTPKIWNHLVVTYDRARFREYVNGRLSSECLATGQLAGGRSAA